MPWINRRVLDAALRQLAVAYQLKYRTVSGDCRGSLVRLWPKSEGCVNHCSGIAVTECRSPFERKSRIASYHQQNATGQGVWENCTTCEGVCLFVRKYSWCFALFILRTETRKSWQTGSTGRRELSTRSPGFSPHPTSPLGLGLHLNTSVRRGKLDEDRRSAIRREKDADDHGYIYLPRSE